MAQPKILIVEDEPINARLIDRFLVEAEFATHLIDDGAAVVPWLKNNDVDLILLDVLLPNRNGLDICKEVRTFSQVPIIITTVRVEDIDRLLGLELGADDYVCKPYNPRELVARVKAVLKRTYYVSPAPAEVVELDPERHSASIFGAPLELTAIEFRLLEVLAEVPGRIYSRDQLIEHAYSDYRDVSERTIDSHIKKLRRKIRAVAMDHELIRSVYGVGYKLEY